jgi:hypothetical protein
MSLNTVNEVSNDRVVALRDGSVKILSRGAISIFSSV